LALAIDTPVDAVLLKPYDPRQVRSVIHNLHAGARPLPAERAQPGRGAISRTISKRAQTWLTFP
jgi:hypothetical protein